VIRQLHHDSLTLFRSLDDLPAHAKGAVVAVGNFDGFHRGHRYLIDKAHQLARAQGRSSAVLTFSRHPRSVIRGDRNFELLSNDLKTLVADGLGIDCYFEQHFDEVTSRLAPHEFVKQILVDRLGAHAVFVGDDFSFGAKRSGNAQSLAEIASGFGVGVHVVSRLKDDSGAIYSSTRIRNCIEVGDFITASALLGRCWQVSGHVAAHQGVATLMLGDVMRPCPGDYLAWVSMLDKDASDTLRPALVMVRVPASRDSIAIPGVERARAGTRISVEFVRSIGFECADGPLAQQAAIG